MSKSTVDIAKAALVLFGMMFGAGNAIFPVLLGHDAGANTLYSMAGFLFAGVLVPFLGMVAMMLYDGDSRAFFGRIGKRPGFALLTLIIFILGPIGSIPRLITISYATMRPYLMGMGPTSFALVACAVCWACVAKRERVMAILAYLLTPILMIALAIIIFDGVFIAPKELIVAGQSKGVCLWQGMEVGYSLLDLFAAFIYAPVILMSLRQGSGSVARKMGWATAIAATMLALSYVGLAYVGAFHGSAVGPDGAREELLRAVSLTLLGDFGGLVACVAMGMACLTTAISLTIVCSTFIHKDLLKGRGSHSYPVLFTLALSFAISTLGFSGIAKLINPLLNFLHPLLILLCLVNIVLKLTVGRRQSIVAQEPQ